MKTKTTIIGSGFAGLSNACFLAKHGYDVEVFEKNEQLGGRARVFETNGYRFDMGPSWYWMPDVFDRFFESFGKKTSDYYTLKRLDPSYRVFFSKNDIVDMPSNFEELKRLFEKLESGSSSRLEQFLSEAQKKYNIGMQQLVYKPSLSITEFFDKRIIANAFSIDLFKSFSSHINKYFNNPQLKSIIEFPVLFLGAMPQETPALYSLMNYADMKLGTWYPMGGMGKIIDGMVELAKELGVKFHTNANVQQIVIDNKNKSKAIIVNDKTITTDIVISAADYNFTEQHLLQKEFRNYTENYWDSRTLAPSCLIYYLGVNKRLKNLLHHNLFFDKDFATHAKEIYKTPEWPTDPLFYVSCPSKTDDAVAPEGKENLFILIPVAPGLKDTEQIKESYFQLIMERLEDLTGEDILNHIEYKKSYAYSDFVSDYNSFKGNAYGLANTLQQTAILKPRIKNNKVNNLYYTGQLTVPGPGIPPCLISGELVANQIKKEHSKIKKT
jgi:phytoene desaturase